MKHILAVLLSALTAALCLWPTWLWLGLHHVAHPVGFWQQLATAGLGLFFLGSAQVVFLGLAAAGVLGIIAAIYDL